MKKPLHEIVRRTRGRGTTGTASKLVANPGTSATNAGGDVGTGQFTFAGRMLAARNDSGWRVAA